jgi:ribosomal protein L32
MSSIIKCPKCGTFNTNRDYCENCGTLISFQVKTDIRELQEKEKRVAEVQWRLENPNWVERMKKHAFVPYRIVGWILYSAFLVVSAIGGAIAWFVAMVAAG